MNFQRALQEQLKIHEEIETAHMKLPIVIQIPVQLGADPFQLWLAKHFRGVNPEGV